MSLKTGKHIHSSQLTRLATAQEVIDWVHELVEQQHAEYLDDRNMFLDPMKNQMNVEDNEWRPIEEESLDDSDWEPMDEESDENWDEEDIDERNTNSEQAIKTPMNDKGEDESMPGDDESSDISEQEEADTSMFENEETTHW